MVARGSRIKPGSRVDNTDASAAPAGAVGIGVAAKVSRWARRAEPGSPGRVVARAGDPEPDSAALAGGSTA